MIKQFYLTHRSDLAGIYNHSQSEQGSYGNEAGTLRSPNLQD